MAKGYVVGTNKCLIPSYDAEQIEEISGYFIGEWSDGNPNNEDRTGRFVTSSNNSNKIELANADSYVSGVSETYEGDTKKAKVNPIGLSVVQDDGTLVAGDKCMPSTNGIAKKSSNNLGYRVVGRVDNKHVQVIVSPNNDMVQRIKANVLTYEEIQASTDLTGKIASASALRTVYFHDKYIDFGSIKGLRLQAWYNPKEALIRYDGTLSGALTYSYIDNLYSIEIPADFPDMPNIIIPIGYASNGLITVVCFPGSQKKFGIAIQNDNGGGTVDTYIAGQYVYRT